MGQIGRRKPKVQSSNNERHLRPWAVSHQRCLSQALVISPARCGLGAGGLLRQSDGILLMQRGHGQLSVTATSEVEHEALDAVRRSHYPEADYFLGRLRFGEARR